MVRAGKFKSPTVSNTNELPAEQPFIASAVKIQSVVRGSRFCSQETSCESFGETEEESRKEADQAAEQEEKGKEE
jgi:hypothetical protein